MYEEPDTSIYYCGILKSHNVVSIPGKDPPKYRAMFIYVGNSGDLEKTLEKNLQPLDRAAAKEVTVKEKDPLGVLMDLERIANKEIDKERRNYDVDKFRDSGEFFSDGGICGTYEIGYRLYFERALIAMLRDYMKKEIEIEYGMTSYDIKVLVEKGRRKEARKHDELRDVA